MKIAFNPSTVAALITPPNNKDITFDLRGRNIFARGVKFCGTDTWRDIKINNVSIGSNILDLRNGSNTTLTNTNGVVTINSTWRPVVDNLTSDSTTSSLSANQGRVLTGLINGKSDSGHTHDDRYLKLTGGIMQLGEGLKFHADDNYFGTYADARIISLLDNNDKVCDGGLIIDERCVLDGKEYVTELLRIRDSEFKWKGSNILHSGNTYVSNNKGYIHNTEITQVNNSDTVDGYHASSLVKFYLSPMTSNAPADSAKNWFVNNLPSASGAIVYNVPGSEKTIIAGKSSGAYGHMLQLNYDDNYLRMLRYRGGSWKSTDWEKISAGYADSAGSVAWDNITGKPSSFTPSVHTHAWNSLTHSSTTENQAILTNGKANGWKLYTLNISRWDNAANNAHSHSNKSVLDGITSALVNSWNTAYNFVSSITGTDTDKVINKWDEIVNFLAGITEDNKLNTLLNSKLSVYELANNTNVGTIKNNGIYYSTTDASSGTLTNSPFNTGFALINMTSYDGGDDLRRSRLAFNAYGEVKISNDRGQANTAETWYNILTSNNSGINGSTIKLNGTSITVYSSSTADGRYVKKSGDTMSGVLTIDTTNFGALIIKRNDDANGASIQFRGKSSVYGYIGLNNGTKDKQFLRWGSDTSKAYTILDTSSTYVSSGKGVINGTTITQVDNATNSTNSTNARKLVNWYSARPTSLNAQFGDGSLRVFYATSSTTEGKPAEDSHILHLAWDNNSGWDAQLAILAHSGKISTRTQNSGTWQPWKTLAFTTDIPSSLKNPYSLTTFGVVYDGSAAKTVTTSNFISQVNEATSIVTDGTMFITSWASNNGFADTNAVNVPYKRKAIHLWEYIKTKTDSLYTTKGHNHDDRYLKLTGGIMTGTINRRSGGSTISGRDHAIIRQTYAPGGSSWNPIACVDTETGTWTLGHLSSGSSDTNFHFCFSTNADYNAGNNNGNYVTLRNKVGTIALLSDIPSSLKNPHALTISLNGTSQGPYDGSAAKSINITPGSIGAATSGHNHDSSYVKYTKVTKSTADNANATPYLYNVENEEVISGYYKYWYIFNMGQYSKGNFGTQIAMPYQDSLTDSELFIRSAKSGSWRTWRRILHSNNYASILDSRYYTKSEVNTKLGTYLPLSGGTVTGNIILKGGTSADMTYAGNVHPYIRFDNSDSSQNVSLIFTDYDTYRRPAGIKLVGNQGNEWFEAANIYATTFYGALSGNASSANKLTTARNIALGTDLRGSANFDGSSNITIYANINACTVQVSSTNGLPFKRIAHFETGSSWNDNALLLYISQGYINGSNGICRVEFRTDNISSSSTSVTAFAAVRWLVRNGYGLDSLYAGYYVTTSKAYIDIYLKTTSSYQGTVIRVLQDSRGGINSNVQLINSYYYSDTNHKEAYNSIEAASTALYNRAYTRIVSGSDVGTVSYSNSTGSVHWNNVTNKPSTFAPAAHTHTVFNNNLMIKGTNGISDSASIHLGIGDSDTGFKWISDGKCQIYANNVAVGEWTSGGMNWFKNPTVNGNKVWNAGNDGSGSGLDADTVDGYHASAFVKMKQFRFNQYNQGTWTKILTITINSTADLQPVIAFSWIPSECNRDIWADFSINWRSNSPIFYAIWKGMASRTLKVVNSSGAIWDVWVSGNKTNWDPFGEIQVTYTHNITSYNGGSLGYSDTDPGGTICITGGLVNYATSATKLQTARTIWGQSFDGTADVSGFMKNVTGLIHGNNIGDDWSDGNNTHPWYGIDYRHCVDSTETGKAYTSISSYSGLYFKTGGYRFIFDGGNVGIGTASPAYKLHVAGDIYSTEYVRASSGFVKGSSSDSYVLLGGGGHKLESSLSVNYAASAGSTNSAIQATNLTPENTPHYFRDPSNSAWRGGMYWGSAGNESMSFVVANGGTRFQFVGGSDIANWTSSTWQSVTPYLTIYSSGIVTPGSVTATNGFIKSNSSDSYVLLGGGGHKAESSLRVAYATSAGSADTLDGVHLSGIFTAFGNNAHNITATIGGVTKSFLVNWAADSDKLDGYHASDLLTSVTNTNNGISVTVGGTTKSISNISVNYAASAGSADTAQYLRSLGNQNCQTGRTQNYGDVYTYNTYANNTGAPTSYTSVIGFGRGIAGTVEIAGGWDNTNLYWRSLRDCCEDWHSWRTVLDSNNYTEFINNYYWANVKISTSSSTTTSPTVSNLTATSSIKMGNILLGYTDEINNSANGSIHLNYRNSGNVSLCQGGGSVGIGTASPTYKLDVNGQMRASGFHHSSMNSDNYILLAGGGYSQGVPVRYWAIYYMYIGNSPTDVTYTKRSGNYDFITSTIWESSEGAVRFVISFPSGYNKNNTLIFGNGDHRTSSSWETPVYVTITTTTDFGSESHIRVMISDDANLNTGFANIYFMCMG